jgi:hybrid polyketide synthase / nonribosomal peptide synthetase ACE1
MDEIFEASLDSPAVKWDSRNPTSYSEIRDRMNRIANALITAGIGIGSHVAVPQESTADWIPSILAIMRIGAVYLPLDQDNPWSRLANIVQDGKPAILLVDNDAEQHSFRLQSPTLQAINVSILETGITQRVPVAATAKSMAAILYTSGST